MTLVSTEDIKMLREETGASIGEIRKALIAADGDYERAKHALSRALGLKGQEKAGRKTAAGVIDAYVHPDRRIGVLVELSCETDFVARNEAFRALAHEIALHIAAMNPLYVRREDVPESVIAAERRLIEEEVIKLGKPSHMTETIVSGKLESHFKDISLLAQPFVKDPDKSVNEIVSEASGKFA